MPKRSSRKSKKGVKNSNRPKRNVRMRKQPARMRVLENDEARVDGCDIQFTGSDATPDEELPKATGGVEPPP
jgi:hypothetical protein